MAVATAVRVRTGRTGRTQRAERTGWEVLTALLAGAAAFLAGTDFDLVRGLTVGGLMGAALAPVWIREASRYRGAALGGVLLLACLFSALALATWRSATHPPTEAGVLFELVPVVSTAMCVGALLWAQQVLSPGVVVCLYAVGSFMTATMNSRFAEDPWRFGFSMPATMLLLGACLLIRRRPRKRLLADMTALGILTAVTALSGARSMSAFLIMTAVLLLWQHRPRTAKRTTSALLSLVLVGALGFGLYRALEGAALDGYLGQSAQERTEEQTQAAGSLILGGRPEIGATVALMLHEPLGYGAGVMATPTDMQAAKQGMSRLGYDPDNGYVEHYMFGSRIEVHSLIGDLWIWFGLAGLVLSGWLLWLATIYLGRSMAHRTGTALGIFLALQLGWNLFFGPIISSLPPLALALGVFLLQRKEAAASPSPAVPVSPKPLAPRRRQGRRSQRTRRRYLAGGPQRA
ncbi:O-antigen ligase family protein [Nocardioides sp. YIM B13467]|uniref:O-antigen ligase family protein n=1 Tax=Nocardioides sp. YIM B13467 TaxID=3366294 RepID=UPI0036704515